LSLVTAPFLVRVISFMALVGTSAVGSLVAVREEGQVGAPTIGATLITALAIYGASLFTYWIVTDAFGFTIDYWSSLFAGMLVAASSWVVLPGIVAMLRSG
jgi:hypothetical protein